LLVRPTVPNSPRITVHLRALVLFLFLFLFVFLLVVTAPTVPARRPTGYPRMYSTPRDTP
jgi:hypothetical protein